MLPQSYNINMLNNKTIYINPNFKGQLPSTEIGVNLHSTSIIPKSAHINPLFLESRNHSHAIHMNPAFLEKFKEKQQVQQQNQKEEHIPLKHVPEVITKNLLPNDSGKIICKSKNRLIREPARNAMQAPVISKPVLPLLPLLVLNKRKLIRKSNLIPAVIATSKAQNCDNLSGKKTKYSLDNRVIKKKALLPPTPKIKRSSFVGRYSLRRSSLSISTNISTIKTLSVNKNFNKKLQVLNINGLLYKSTKNSLKLKEVAVQDNNNTSLNVSNNQKEGIKKTLRSNQGLTIFVRGTKYVMDANKFKLTRITNTDNSLSKADINKKPIATTCKRIDIGGYTYVTVNSSKNILIRTTNHLSRAYVHNAKQKSLQFLTKHLVKTNIPCPIYQRVGKCAAFERGKCSKVHNKNQVAICNKFLRGECHNTKCLLSHSVSLSKMPVCKFFLQGVCVRNDCPYLHKKLSNQAELCTEFLRGFCQLADKCNKRHEFVCPEIEKNNKCTTRNCVYCNAKRRKEMQTVKKLERTKSNSTMTNLSSSINSIEVKENPCKRYFIESCSETSKSHDEYSKNAGNFNCNKNDYYIETSRDVESVRKIRPKLGALPSYIPL